MSAKPDINGRANVLHRKIPGCLNTVTVYKVVMYYKFRYGKSFILNPFGISTSSLKDKSEIISHVSVVKVYIYNKMLYIRDIIY